MEEMAGKDPEVKKTSDALNDDVLSQNNDLLITVSSSSTLISDRSSGTVEIDANKSTSEETEEMPKLIETFEPEKSRKNVKFNLRKSLAWDSAFFTSDGVLDADELSTMIEGGDKGVKHYLPGIEEEVYRSMESISTLESDNLSLECLEAELFQDIRASIQNSNKSSNLNNSCIKFSSGKIDSQPNVRSASKKADRDSAKRLGAKTKDNNDTSSVPQPKVVSRVNLNMNSMSTLTKRASLSANHAKKDQDTSKQAQVTQNGSQSAKTTTQVSKVTGVVGPRRGVRKPLLSSKSSSLGTSTALTMNPTRPSSSCSNSSSCSSGTDVKVRSSLSRKKVDNKTGKLTTTSMIPLTPSRINMKNKPPPVNSNLSSSILPASSMSEWSRQSSSSTSTIDRKSASRGSIDTSVQSDLRIHPTDRISNRKGNQSVAVHPSQTGSVSRNPAVQPTGLRMPSPKIGFFDGGKSGVRTPNGGMRSQSTLPTGAPKPGATHFSQTSSNGVKFGKIPPPITSAVATNKKPNPQKIATKPSQQEQTSKPETKTCPVTSDVTDHKSESSLNLCVNPSNVDSDSHKQSDLGNNGYEVLSNECVVVKDDIVDASDHKSESSLNLCINLSNVDSTSNKQFDLGNNGYEVLSNECVVVKDDIVDASNHKSESSLNLCVNLSNVDSASNKQSDLGNNGYEVLSNECVVMKDDKVDASDHKSESSLNLCVNLSNVDSSSNKQPDLGNNSYDVPSNECLVVKDNKMDALDYKSESSLNICVNPSNVDSDSNERPDLGNKGYEVLSNECVVVKDDKMDKFNVRDGSRTPFAVKNSASDTDTEVTEKTVNLFFIDSQQQNENCEVV